MKRKNRKILSRTAATTQSIIATRHDDLVTLRAKIRANTDYQGVDHV
ncbi:hypothetical protein DLM_1760 [Aquitalea magnusonii]|uniref:Uncharacterized protein n=1 Tax=Aquitalea magnusonii TaxID=332411 RepID=A0A3G9GJ03_9NEIS|nr:hypothetical protein DLM_1760 [Aquitalea magnusonii]